MTRRRLLLTSVLLASLLALLLALAAAALLAHRAWQGFLQDQGLEELNWQGLSVSRTRLQIEHFSLSRVQAGHRLDLQGAGLNVNWRWQGFKPQPLRLRMAQLAVAWQPAPGASSPSSAFSLPSLPQQWPDWLPQQVSIDQFSAHLPCESGACPLSGGLWVQLQSGSQVQASSLEGVSGQAELHIRLPEPWPLSSPSPSPSSSPYRGNLEGQLSLAVQLNEGQWQGQVTETRLSIQLPQLTQAGWQLQDLHADLALSGELDDARASLRLEQGSSLRLGQMESVAETEPDTNTRLRDLALNLQGLEMSAHYNDSYKPGEDSWAGFLTQFNVQGPLELALGELQAPYLEPQAWNFSGKLDADLTQAQVTGRLRNRAEASLDLTLDYAFGGELLAEAQLSSQGTNGARSLAQTFPDWPEDLTISDGRFNTQARLTVPPQGEASLEGQLQFEALSGLYDRTAWSGLTGLINFSLQGEQLKLRAPGLHLNSINPGISAGPLDLTGQYQASLGQPLGGRLTLNQARLQLFGGELWLEPDSWQLAEMPIRFPFKFQHLELAQLMQAYPTEGLAGTGRLNGELPVLIDEEGISLAQGQLAALEPGGTLELPADSVRALSQANQTTQLVARALQNFDYSVLTSRIDYTQNGTLLLGLHLQGKSPNIPGDRPVVLNINLEEDLAALLTSLQLSGRVNEAVTKKVQEMLRQQEQTP